MDYPILDARATGARIRELRMSRHITVEQIARFMGFESEQAVYKWQRGDSLPTVDNLYALSRLFGTSVDEILRGTKEEDEMSSSFALYRHFLMWHEQLGVIALYRHFLIWHEQLGVIALLCQRQLLY